LCEGCNTSRKTVIWSISAAEELPWILFEREYIGFRLASSGKLRACRFIRAPEIEPQRKKALGKRRSGFYHFDIFVNQSFDILENH